MGGDETAGGERGIDRRAASGRAPFQGGVSVGGGSLPHRDPAAAVAFSVGEFDVATIPTLPLRSAAEGLIAQAVAGLPGVTIGPTGEIALDPAEIVEDPGAVLDSSIESVRSHDAYVGLRAFLTLAAKVDLDDPPVKWQTVGPVTLGGALARLGLPDERAFPLALTLVRARLAAVSSTIGAALPRSSQLAIIDEPSLDGLMTPDFPIPPDESVDLMSTAMAAVDHAATVGIHCCGRFDLATVLAAGPRVISLPVDDHLLDWAGYLARFVDDGGVVAWGAVPIDGPVSESAERHWRALSDLWCGLVRRGCDPVTLRRQSMITPSCGLAAHAVSVARRIARQTGEVSRRVKDQAGATRFALGA